MTESERSDLMAEFRKLQKETVGIRSVFAEKLPFSSTNIKTQKLIKDLHNLCEKAVKRQDDQNEINKNLIEELRQIRKEASETKRNQEQITNKILSELHLVRKELKETKKMQSAQNQEMKQVQNELRMSSKNSKTINEPKNSGITSTPYQIFVRISGRSNTLEVCATNTIKDLKIKIEEKSAIPSDFIWLSCGVRALHEGYDDRTLYDFNIGPESTIEVYFRPGR